MSFRRLHPEAPRLSSGSTLAQPPLRLAPYGSVPMARMHVLRGGARSISLISCTQRLISTPCLPRPASGLGSTVHRHRERTCQRMVSASRQQLGVLERSGEWTGYREDKYHELLDKLFDLHGKVAVVTGGAQGVGKAMASGLARCGADLALLDIKPREEIDRAVGDIFEATGKAPLSVSVDVRDKEAVKEAMKTVHDAFGQLDILVANAGIMGHLERPEDMSPDNWTNVFKTNVDGVFNSATAAYDYMKVHKHGKIIMMSSIAGLTGFGMQAAYCATKGALIPLAKSLALAWAADGIQVNCLAPGAVNTPFTDPVLGTREKVEYILSRIPAGRLGVPEDFVGPCVFLASHASDYITGSTLVIDGGGLSVPMLGVNPTQIGKK